MQIILRDAFLAALLAFLLSVVLLGAHTETSNAVLVIDWRMDDVALWVGCVFAGRLALGLSNHGHRQLALMIGMCGAVLAILPFWIAMPAIFSNTISRVLLGGGSAALLIRSIWPFMPEQKIKIPIRLRDHTRNTRWLGIGGLIFALCLPAIFHERASIELATLLFIYIMLGWGLNIVVGLAGLLDLGFVAFYAVGAYGYALLSQHFGLSFWQTLPLAGLMGAFAGFLLGVPVLKLRGDYFAIVTMGFGEIIRIFLINCQDLTGGPNGITGIARPSFFGLATFSRTTGNDGLPTFHSLFGIDYSPLHRIIFLYYLIVMLALIVNFVGLRLRRLPLGRAWEALREDDIACQALGINRRNIKLAAFMISACFGGFAGSFFAARQGFISPESFTFMESAIILAIVVLGGMGSQTGVVLATLFVVFLPEYFRDLELYRMLMFGVAMVAIMIFRPGGLLAHRDPSVRLKDHRSVEVPS